MHELKPDQLTTPIDLMVAPQEMVTVVDPRHPLFGRNLPCIGITNSSRRGRCCLVWLRPWVERHVPVSATNLQFDPQTLSPLPISVESLQQLLYEFTCMTRASKGEEGHDTTDSPFSRSSASQSNSTAARVDDSQFAATSNDPPGADHDVSGLSASPKGGHV